MSAFALAATISPGPVNLVCPSSGTRYPVSRGLIFVSGATIGFIALFISLGLGLYFLLTLACWVYAGASLRQQVQRHVVLATVNRVLVLLLAAGCLYLVIG
jgi:threonine/homoserine/homoserine lactone efflux protein